MLSVSTRVITEATGSQVSYIIFIASLHLIGHTRVFFFFFFRILSCTSARQVQTHHASSTSKYSLQKHSVIRKEYTVGVASGVSKEMKEFLDRNVNVY